MRVSVLCSLLMFSSVYLCFRSCIAQGGPPMLTDDSDTPGNGNWENNFAISFEGSKNNYLLAFPLLDINYGLGERIQLKIEMPWVKEQGEAIANKFDNITLGCKYMILDEDSDGVFLSVYPQPIISFNPDDHSGKTTLGIILPVAASKQFFKTGFNVQTGYQILGNEQQWFYGFVIDHAVGPYVLLLAEIHGTIGREAIASQTGDDEIFFRAGTFLNIGIQLKPSKKYFINAAVGKDLDAHRIFTDEARYYSYLGLQLNL